MTCPICLFKPTKPVKISCGHVYCQKCIETFVTKKVESLHSFMSNDNNNPFRCPVGTCDQEMALENSVYKLIKSPSVKKKLDDWLLDQRHPKCQFLDVCPNVKCQAKEQMRYPKDMNFANIQDGKDLAMMAYCNVCGATWCEWCLARINGPHRDCKVDRVLQLCAKYRTASSEKVKDMARKKFPWLPRYAALLREDYIVRGWVKENASICPGCGMGIERTEGCNHMICLQCGTHYCYMCSNYQYECSCI